MIKNWKNWTRWGAGLVGVLFAGWLAILIAEWRGFSNSDSAAWVQAIFSVLAIVAAIWISGSQREAEDAREAQNRKDAILAVAMLIGRAEAIVKVLSREPMGNPSVAAYHSMAVIAERLESLDMVATPSPVILRASLESANLLRRYIDFRKSGVFGGNNDIGELLGRQCEKVLIFYGLSDADMPRPV